jgi:hypothetical protein
MNTSAPKAGSVFSTCAIQLAVVPQQTMRWDPPSCHPNEEAMAKIDRFCHRIYNVPITWLCSYAALKKYGQQLKDFIKDYGDEVAIYEHGISCLRSLDNKPQEFQPWVEEAGLRRPDENFKSREAESTGGKAWHDMTYTDQQTALSYLKRAYEAFLNSPVRILASPCTNEETIRVMSEIGLDVLWGYNWNYFCEGINQKGSLIHPFYISRENHSVPEQDEGKNKVLAIHWGTFSPVIGSHVETHSRMGAPGFCGNALELAIRSEGLDKFDHHRKMIEEWASWAAWNPFVHIPIELEANWFSEDEISKELYDQYPTCTSTTTEVLYTQIETALRVGAKPVTMSQFADWHKTNMKDTTPMVTYSQDHLPDVRNRGKDLAYAPHVVYCDKRRQYWFDQSRGFNYVRKYSYSPIVSEKDIVNEYPFTDEPQVYLKIKHALNVMTGIILTPEKVAYELTEFELSAYRDVPDYAAILWQANLPSYIKDSDIETGGVLREFRTVREKNFAILFADLKKGDDNKFIFRSDLPKEYIRIVRSEKIGKRYEVWIENDAEEVHLHTLKVQTLPGLKVGGFWWDGRYHKTIFRLGPAHYDRDTGMLMLRALYPATFKLNSGLTRLSLELL